MVFTILYINISELFKASDVRSAVTDIMSVYMKTVQSILRYITEHWNGHSYLQDDE